MPDPSPPMDAFADLHQAACEGDLALVRALLEKGMEPGGFDDLGLTPLHYAARNEHLAIISLLLRAGADVNARDEAHLGDTALGDVAGSCSFALAQALINAGADPALPGWMLLTAVDRARERKRGDGPRVYELLLSKAVPGGDGASMK